MIKVTYFLLWGEGLNETLFDKIPPERAVSLIQASLWPLNPFFPKLFKATLSLQFILLET